MLFSKSNNWFLHCHCTKAKIFIQTVKIFYLNICIYYILSFNLSESKNKLKMKTAALKHQLLSSFVSLQDFSSHVSINKKHIFS